MSLLLGYSLGLFVVVFWNREMPQWHCLDSFLVTHLVSSSTSNFLIWDKVHVDNSFPCSSITFFCFVPGQHVAKIYSISCGW